MKVVPVCLSLAPLLHGALANLSLFVPGFDPQPLSATALGTDASSRTTWQIVTGSQTDTNQDFGFIGTATLVEGPSDAHIVYQLPADEANGGTTPIDVDVTCNIANGLATCTANKGYDSTPVPLGTEGPLLVQGNAAAPTAGASGASASATPGSSGAALPSNTGSSTAPAASRTSSSSSNTSGSSRAAPFGVVIVGILFGVGSLVL